MSEPPGGQAVGRSDAPVGNELPAELEAYLSGLG